MHADIDDPWLTLVSPLGKIYLHAARITSHSYSPDPAHTPLSSAEKAHAEHLQGHARRNYMLTRIWLRTLLGAALGQAPAQVELEKDPQGKPVLSGGSLHFNWSHSRDACVLAFSRSARLGVDIEFHRDSWPRNVAERFFHPNELALLDGQAPAHARSAFYRLWSRKEAHYKCVGGQFMGGSLALDLHAHRVGDVHLWDFQGPFPDERHALGLAASPV